VTIIDTPDNQYNATATGLLLATIPAGQISTGAITVPGNATALMVLPEGESIPTTNECTCVGLTSDTAYPGVVLGSGNGIISQSARVFTVAPSIDATVDIGFQTAPTSKWYVVSLTNTSPFGVVQ
jgi:hypothetical protein